MRFKRKEKPLFGCPFCNDTREESRYYILLDIQTNGCSSCVFEGINWAVKKMRKEKDSKEKQ